MSGDFIGIVDQLGNKLCIGDRVVFCPYERSAELKCGEIDEVIEKPKTKTVKVKTKLQWKDEVVFRFMAHETETLRLIKL